MNKTTQEDTLLEFPCDFSIKSMGMANNGFDQVVVEIVRRHVPELSEGAVTMRNSKGGKYVSVTVTLTAQSKAQLDAIYQDLTDSPHVIMSL